MSRTNFAVAYAALGLILTPADSDRVNATARLLELLGDPETGIDPRLTVFDTCPRVIEQIPALLHDPNRPEDVIKVDVDDEGRGGDAYDALRYGLMVKGVGAQPSRLVAAPDPLAAIDASVAW